MWTTLKSVKDKTLTYLFYDIGVTSNKNTNWGKIRLNDEVTSNGTLLTATGNYAHYIVVNNNKRFSPNFCIELKVGYSQNTAINFMDSNVNLDSKHWLFSNSSYKFIVTDNGYSVSKDGEEPTSYSYSWENVRISIFINSNGNTVIYNNFVVYEI